MAARTLSQIEATSGGPSMVPGSNTEAFVRFVDVRGPFKVETLYFQCEDSDDFTADDTFNSRLAHPLFAIINAVQDLEDTTQFNQISVDLNTDETNANFKQLTIRDCEDFNSMGILIQVYGF